MSFADELAALNEWVFFREFVYSCSTFQSSPGHEVELADNLICVGDLLIAYQIKERELVPGANEQTESRWFKKKVLKKAASQVRDTVSYIGRGGSIRLQNHRGHDVDLIFDSGRRVHKLIVYLPKHVFPTECQRVRYHRSSTVGIIHVIPAHDYLGIVRTLITPTEVAEYLSFREQLINRWEEQIADVPERALVGQYLHGDPDKHPSLGFLEYVNRLEHRAEEWDISALIAKFCDRMASDRASDDYYLIIRELALLKRNECHEFKTRFLLSIDKAHENDFVLPYRIAVPRTNCGFLFLPIMKEGAARRTILLEHCTRMHKYEQRLPKCIGVSILDDGVGVNAEWLYIESDWQEDPHMDELLKTNNPLRGVSTRELPRYTFRETP